MFSLSKRIVSAGCVTIAVSFSGCSNSDPTSAVQATKLSADKYYDSMGWGSVNSNDWDMVESANQYLTTYADASKELKAAFAKQLEHAGSTMTKKRSMLDQPGSLRQVGTLNKEALTVSHLWLFSVSRLIHYASIESVTSEDRKQLLTDALGSLEKATKFGDDKVDVFYVNLQALCSAATPECAQWILRAMEVRILLESDSLIAPADKRLIVKIFDYVSNDNKPIIDALVAEYMLTPKAGWTIADRNAKLLSLVPQAEPVSTNNLLTNGESNLNVESK